MSWPLHQALFVQGRTLCGIHSTKGKIDFGTERENIKIKGKTLHVNNSIYGSVQGSNLS